MKFGRGQHIRTAAVLQKMSDAQKGKHHTPETKAKIARARTGVRLSQATRNKISAIHRNRPKPNQRGPKSPRWRGGITPLYRALRNSLEYRLWRTAVFERDGYTCVWCAKKGVRLNADHIKPFALYPELRFALDNGRTLCVPCHRSTDTFGLRTPRPCKN